MHGRKHTYETVLPLLKIWLCCLCLFLSLAQNGFGQDSTATKGAKTETAAAKKEGGLVSKLLKKLSGDAKKAKAEKQKLKAELKASKDSLQVFGWHASWLSNTYQNYNYNLLTTLSYYACTMSKENDSLLHYRTPSWTSSNVSKLIKLAEGDECNVLLTLKSDDKDAITLLLEDSLAQEQNISILINLTDTIQHLNGVNIVFDGLPLSHSGQLTAYIKKLSSALKKEGKSIVLSLPAIDFGNKYNIKELNKYVDQFVVMGYNYYHAKSAKAGPVAPLKGDRKWGRFHLKKTVDDYLKAGLPKSKFILAMPHYGAVWQVDSLKNGRVKHRFHKHLEYREIMEKIGKNKIDYDSVSHTAHITYKNNSRTYICYFDNAKSLNHKIDWVKKQRLAGIGIWALGYDDGRKELWQNISDNIDVVKLPAVSYQVDTTSAKVTQAKADSAKAALTAVAPTANDTATSGLDAMKESANAAAESFLKKYEGVLTQGKVLLVAGVTLLIFVVLGVLKSLFYEEVFSKLIISDWKTYFKVSLVFLSIFTSLIFTLKLVFDDTLIVDEISHISGNDTYSMYKTIRNYILIIGVIFWLILQGLSVKLFFKFNKDLP